MVKREQSGTSRQAFGKLLETIPLRLLIIVVVLLMSVVAIGAFLLGTRGDTVQKEATSVKEELQVEQAKGVVANELATEQLDLCADPAAQVAIRATGSQACELAVEVKEQHTERGERGEPGVPGEEGPRGLRGPGPTPEQVDAAVESWFSSNPGSERTLTTVTRVVADYLRTNPPEPGRPPTPEEIASSVAGYCSVDQRCRGIQGAQGADGAEGPRGPQGEQGPAPTAQQIQDAVTAYCSTDDRCRGPRGPQGPQGVSVTAMATGRNAEGVCVLTATLEDPAAGTSRQVDVQINDEICEPPPGNGSLLGGN